MLLGVFYDLLPSISAKVSELAAGFSYLFTVQVGEWYNLSYLNLGKKIRWIKPIKNIPWRSYLQMSFNNVELIWEGNIRAIIPCLCTENVMASLSLNSIWKLRGWRQTTLVNCWPVLLCVHNKIYIDGIMANCHGKTVKVDVLLDKAILG